MITLSPDLAEAARGRAFIGEVASEAGFPEERVFDITVACSEAIANAIEHSPVKGEVHVRTILRPNRLEVEVQGPGEFQAPDRLKKRETRGLGLPLMARLSDHLALFSGPKGETFVSLTFYRPGFPGSQDPDGVTPPWITEVVEENELVAAITGAVPVGLYVTDPELRIRWANAAYQQFLEEPYRSQPLEGMSIGDVVPGSENAKSLEILRTVSRTGEPAFFPEFEYVGFARGVTWWRWELLPLKQDRAEPPYDVLTVISEITEQVLQRRKVEAASRSYTALAENGGFVFAFCRTVFDADGRAVDFEYIEVNEAHETFTGYPAETFVGKKVTEAIPGYSQELIDRLNRVALTGEPSEDEIFEPHLGRWYRLNSYSPEPGYFVTLARDITEGKRVEEQMRRQLEVLAQISDAVIATDLAFRITSWNQAAELLYGWPAEEALGHLMSERIPTEYLGEERERVAEEFRRNGSWRGEVIQKRRDGTKLAILSSVVLSRDADGNPTGALAVNRDITERKRAEEALERSRGHLSFLLELNDALLPLDDPVEIQAAATKLLGERLKTDRVFYGEIVKEKGVETLVITRDFHAPGVPSLTGRFPFKKFSNTDYDNYRAGRTVWSANVQTDAREPSQREAYRAADTAAFIGVPLVKRGELVSVLGVLQRQPREWTPEEIRLAEETVDRTWQAVRRGRAEEALRESETKYKSLFDSLDEGFFVIDVIFDENDRPVDLYYVEANATAARILGKDWTGKRLSEIGEGYEEYWFEIFGRVALTGESVREQRYAAPDDKWWDFYVFKLGGPESRRIGNTFLDITERKRAEGQLSLSGERLGTAHLNAPVNVLMQDLDTRYVASTSGERLADLSLGPGEMGELIRSIDWSQAPLGTMDTWSPVLRMVVRLMLANRFPMILWWGPEFVQFYNDPYRPIPGGKHPRAMGQPARECWSEIWDVIGPLIETPFRGGPATWMEDIYLEIDRHGYVEETHFTIAYSPVPDETAPAGIGGVLATVHEITGNVVGDRRVLALRDLGTRSAEARTAEEACALAAETLAAHAKDIPFALLYLIDPDRECARVAGAAGVAEGEPAYLPVIALAGDEAGNAIWPLGESFRNETMQTVTNLADRLGGDVPRGPWTDPPHTAVVVPIRSNKAHYLAGFLVAGVSARLQLDDQYRDFLDLVAAQIATSIANAREYEEEKRRAEALAEIDRAKTIFFSNVSHEFRTPLTLMLGPIEELLSRSQTELPPAAKGQLEVAHRNSLRLLRLVNTLLDFSRTEAGRARAVFEPTDLAAFTAELASVFRAATERAGLQLTVDCPHISEPVYVDREMWEKIVLNLISNAFKFTFEGEIDVSLRAHDENVELRIRDTGVGIPAEAMPRLFERFHRVESVRSRTHEGSGIGLALVEELVKLHGGSVRAESRLDVGTTFVVTLPLGSDHLPREQIGGTRTLASSSQGAAPFVEEAMRWLPDDLPAVEPDRAVPELMPVFCPGIDADESRARVLVADDNADMRQYLARLLARQYIVQTVPDGQAALAAARDRRPDVVLSDVMMPQLDGIGLVRELRADPQLKTVPVILLSARAGEEARIEGLQQGAADYLVKPFSARELLAHVGAQIELARVRSEADEVLRESEERYRVLAEENERLYRQQLDIAENLQAAFLHVPSEIGPVRLGHIYRSATEAARVGGDFYDVFEVKEGQIAVLIGDVSGHGIQAARAATLVKDVVHAFAHRSLRTHEVLRRTNALLIEKNLPGFVTVFLGILNTKTGQLRYSSAGHPDTLLRRASGTVERLGGGSSPLGVYPDATWKPHAVDLEAHDLLVLYTDGVIEARRNGELFGEKRLEALVKRRRISPERFPHLILDQVSAFSGGTLQDDVAILTLLLAAKGNSEPRRSVQVAP